MTRRLPHKGLRRATFLRALADGETVAAACALSRLKWSTLYAWRRGEPKFRAAWDEAVRLGQEALAARFDGELVRRAIDGVDDPVFHAGAVVGERKRYSDHLLIVPKANFGSDLTMMTMIMIASITMMMTVLVMIIVSLAGEAATATTTSSTSSPPCPS